MTFSEFITEWNDKIADHDGVYGGQCMDVKSFFCKQVLNIVGSVLVAPTAYEAFQKGDVRFEKILASYGGQKPQNGDIIFWDKGVGSAGHVAIFIEDLGNGSFKSFDQNWPVGSPCHVQVHNYNNVVGWLRFKVAPTPEPINEKRYMNIAKTGQMIYTKITDAIGQEFTEFWVIYKKKEKQEDGTTKEVEVKRPVKQHITLCAEVFANNDQFRRWSTDEQMKLLAGYPEGKEYDITEQFKNHPELFEKA